MGITIASVEDIIKESINNDFTDKTFLMLGYQGSNLSKSMLYVIAKKLGAKLNYSVLKRITGGCDSASFFKSLGFKEVHAMDISAYEGADIIFDLNRRELPPELKNRFDYIWDGGTTEHVFDYAQALRNIAEMLKVGGKIFHYVPACGWFNHGYYSLSPSLFQDFYKDNGFQIEHINIILKKDFSETYTSLGDWVSTEPDYRIFNLRDTDGLPGYNGILRCVAKKIRSENEIVNSKQTHWYGIVNGEWLMEMWDADLNFADDNPAVGIFGINNFAKNFLEIMQHSKNFAPHKIKAFFVDDVQNSPKNFFGYDVLPHDKILELGIKNLFLATPDFNVYKNFSVLQSYGINIVSLGEYQPAFQS